jgi:hypothetical protein
MSPVIVFTAEFGSRAMPKSVIFAMPPLSTMMFEGFTSRCTMSCSCANHRPSATIAMMSTTCAGGRSLPPAMMSLSSCPSRYSIAMYAHCSVLPTS